jgi:hypothetical protein
MSHLRSPREADKRWHCNEVDSSVESEFATGISEERTWAREAEESSLLQTAFKKDPVKVDWEDLAYGLLICKICRSAIAL